MRSAEAPSGLSAPSGAGGSVSAGTGEVLALHDVSFNFPDGTIVLDGVSTAIQAATVVGVVGPSGCGKSTLLNAIAGLIETTGGTIDRNFVDPGRHPLAMVFQKDTLLPWLTATENVRFFSRFRSHRPEGRRFGRAATNSREIDERVASLLRLGHLEERAKAYPYQLSGGMKRRLAFLAAVASQPEVLLLDEPFSAVDEPTRIGIHQDVFRVLRALRITALLVTHDLAEAITLCDRVLILSNRPAKVAKEYAIPFGDERDMLHIRARPEFLQLYGQLWNELSEQIGKQTSTAPVR